LLKNVPVSNDPCGRYVYSIPNPNNENQYVTRADWIVSPNHMIFGRYFLTDFDNPSVYQATCSPRLARGFKSARNLSFWAMNQLSGPRW